MFFFIAAVIIVINSPYDATGFEYGQDTIFGSFQANLLVATIILSGFVSMFLWPLARWFQFIVSSFTLLLIFASFCWIFFHDLNSKAFVTYTIASNHTVSIRGELINQGILIQGHWNCFFSINNLNVTLCKGRLISKRLFGVFQFFQRPNEKFLPQLARAKIRIFKFVFWKNSG